MTGMTDLLSRPRTRSGPAAPERSLPPLWWRAATAGLGAAFGVLAVCMALGLAAWFASDAGAHGDTRDAIRVGADAWLLAHGAGLQLPGVTVTAVPLGLTALSLYAAARAGRWAVRTSAPEDVAGTVLGGVVLVGLYVLVALVTALVAATPEARPGLGPALLGGLLVALAGGGGGMLRASASTRGALRRLPAGVRAVASGSLAAVLLMLAAGSVLTVVALLLDLGEAANVLSRLHPDVAGAALYTTVTAAVAPNAGLLGAAYLLGPGFAVGTGTLVSPSGVALGPLPAFPLLAALPAPGPASAWTTALVGVPVVAGLLTGVLVTRRYPARGWDTGALRGLAAGVVGGALLAGAVALAGGAVGPGRMADVGAVPLDVLAAAVVALGGGGLVGGVLGTWRTRRVSSPGPAPEAGADPDTEDTVRL
jgi:hypothetical protein